MSKSAEAVLVKGLRHDRNDRDGAVGNRPSGIQRRCAGVADRRECAGQARRPRSPSRRPWRSALGFARRTSRALRRKPRAAERSASATWRLACALGSTLLWFASASAGLPDRAYTLRELLDRAAVIVIAETAPLEGASDTGPLREGLLCVRHVMRGAPPQGPLRFRVDGPRLPRGASAIWFLAAPGPDGVYVIDHPQCAYDVSHRAVVEKALRDPSRVSPGYYLRREDERLAEAVRVARELGALAAAAPGRSPEGLELAVRQRSSLVERGSGLPASGSGARTSPERPGSGESVGLEFVLRNAGARALLVCESAEDCFFVRVEREGRTRVVRAVEESPGASAAAELGPLVSGHDFTVLEPGAMLVRKFTIARKTVPLLREAGSVKIGGVYRYSGPGREALSLPAEPWRGVVASASFELTLAEPVRSEEYTGK